MIDELKQELCLYCNDLSKWNRNIKERELTLSLVDNEVNLIVNTGDEILAFDIDYCLYCGRKLK